MDGSRGSIVVGDSQEMQVPEILLEDPITPLTRVRLVPNADKWFGDRDVARVISETIRTYYKGPFTCLRDAPEDHKRFWWNCFKERFTWDPQHEALVRKKWQQKVRMRMKDIVNKAGKEGPAKIIPWMTDDLRASLKSKRGTDEPFKKQFEQNKKNKTEGPKAKIGHSQEKYEQLKADIDIKGGSAADDRLFFKACGGWTEKGTIYGIGRYGPVLYERLMTSRRNGYSTTSAYSSPLAYSSPIVTQLQDQPQTIQNELQTMQNELQMAQNELQTMQAGLQVKEEELRSTRDELESTRKHLEDKRIGLLELNARFDSFSALFGHPTHASSS